MKLSVFRLLHQNCKMFYIGESVLTRIKLVIIWGNCYGTLLLLLKTSPKIELIRFEYRYNGFPKALKQIAVDILIWQNSINSTVVMLCTNIQIIY